MSSLPDSTSSASPSKIVDVAIGYMAAKQLFAASEAGVFAALADGPATAAEIAERAGIPANVARILADAMSSLDLLTRTDGVYANTPATARYLAGSAGDLDLRKFLAFLDAVSYGHWLGFINTVRTGKPGDLDMSGDRMDIFMGGVMTYNALHAKMLADNFDFSPYTKVLDYGGLSVSFLVEALTANSALNGTFFSGGPLVEAARGVLAEAGLNERVEIVEGDPLQGDIPTGFDLVFLEHVAHRYDDEQNRTIVKRAREAAVPGAKLLLLDFFLDNDDKQRSIDALHAGEYLTIDGTIVYPEDQVHGWLTEAGWTPVETLALPGSPRVIVAEAR
ncbi:methyltransferase dimerization domain-containing protein [Streptosporangium sp. NPDC000239]|uniref:Methyltransferase dimerization domain-containing protein n=1 Tax=Streptosporangium jomthongense TaxID=1193683 RepID=A0ABV8EZW5_9ACTN